MQALKDRILKDGKGIGTEIVKVDSFLNHQIDVEFMNKIGQAFKERFKDVNITKILTIESSGIAIASIAAQYFNVPVVFAKKTSSRNLDQETYDSEVYSFTKQQTYIIKVSRKYISPEDHVLILDDFLANGKAVEGLLDIVNQAEATLEGVGIVIEKGFQDGGKRLRNQDVRIESLAIIEKIEEGNIKFRDY
jgi:xanthine phosphoribosyltransferase